MPGCAGGARSQALLPSGLREGVFTMGYDGWADPYTYPETDVLINKLNIRDPQVMMQADADLAYYRLEQMYDDPVVGAFDLDHLRAIHRRLLPRRRSRARR